MIGLKCSLLLIVAGLYSSHAMPEIFRNHHIHGGELQDRDLYNSKELCLDRCAATKCYGFDFNYREKSCWLFTDDSECGVMQRKDGCDHYRFHDCQGSEFDQLSSLVHFPDSHGLGGTFVNGMGSVRECYERCKQDALCLTFDWDARFRGCWLHGSRTSCTRLQQKEGCTHYRLKTDCNDDCTQYVFKDYFGVNRPDGVQIARAVTFEQCKTLCGLRSTCKMVDYNIQARTCWEHTTDGSPTPNNCCRHSAKVCANGNTIPQMPPTTRPPRIEPTTVQTVTAPPNIIPDNSRPDYSGQCPSDLQVFNNTRRLGGTVVPNILSREECKRWCLNPVNQCFAVDFNSKTTSSDRCYAHAAVFPSDDMDVDSDDCCVQYRKVSCAFKTCLVHSEKDVTNAISLGPLQTLFSLIENEVNINPADIGTNLDPNVFSLVPCVGSCSVQTRSFVDANGNPDVYQAQYITRSCEPDIISRNNPNKQCYEKGPELGTAGEVVSKCTCTGDKCNAFGNTITRDCIAHYPLDFNTFDLTQNKRHGVAYNLEYEGDDVAKNWSAKFSGKSFIQINSLNTILLGSLGEAPTFIIGPYFTVSLWFKLTRVTNTDMTLISNGARGSASLEIYSMPVDGDQRMMVGTIQIGDTHYTVIRNVVYDTWYNLMLMVTVNPVQNVYSLKMFLTPQGGATVEAETLTDISVTDEIPRVQQVNNPVCIGKQYVPTNSNFPYNVNVPGDFYVGLMDEIYLFGNDLSEAQRNSVRGVSYSPNRFRP